MLKYPQVKLGGEESNGNQHEKIAAIKELQAQGYGPYQISNQVGVDPKTVRKYMKQEDFSPATPDQSRVCGKLSPWIPMIRTWLEEDQQHRRKQRHTAKRIYDRLCKEAPGFFAAATGP